MAALRRKAPFLFDYHDTKEDVTDAIDARVPLDHSRNLLGAVGVMGLGLLIYSAVSISEPEQQLVYELSGPELTWVPDTAVVRNNKLGRAQHLAKIVRGRVGNRQNTGMGRIRPVGPNLGANGLNSASTRGGVGSPTSEFLLPRACFGQADSGGDKRLCGGVPPG